MKFSDFRLIEPIYRAIQAEGYDTPTPIQSEAIPHVLAGRDVLGSAQTGTGKTAAFALPVLHRIEEFRRTNKTNRLPRCLVLAPTRELAQQIADSFKTYGRFLKLPHVVIYGGVNQRPQVNALRNGAAIIIATPGRLMDLMNQGHVNLQGIDCLILDEADRMLDMGFLPDIRKITAKVPSERQTLLFSATMPNAIKQLADSLQKDAIRIALAPKQPTADGISQAVYFVKQAQKSELLSHLISHHGINRAIVFTRTKHRADKVMMHLKNSGLPTEVIHGNKTQHARQRSLDRFRSGKASILVATDIAARGIDVDGVTHVINYDITNDPENHVHRIGRTARAGAQGAAFSFCDHEEQGLLRAIQRSHSNEIEICQDHPELTFTPSKASASGGQGGQGRGKNRSNNYRSSGKPRNKARRGQFFKSRSSR